MFYFHLVDADNIFPKLNKWLVRLILNLDSSHQTQSSLLYERALECQLDYHKK
jgi:hypothetical protein